MRAPSNVGIRASRLTTAKTRKLNFLIVGSFIGILVLGLVWKQQAAASASLKSLYEATDRGTAYLLDLLHRGDDEVDEHDDPAGLQLRNQASLKPAVTGAYPDKEIPLPPRIDLTFYTTARAVGPAQVAAIRSWLALGASVLVFVDNLTEVAEVPTTFAAESGLEEKDRLKLYQTPLPRSLLGAPRLDLVMEAGELYAETKWLCLINADIVLPSRFGDLISGPFKKKDILAIGERLDCRTNPEISRLPKSVKSFEDLEHWSMAPCWPHGSGGKDYFLYRKGFFERRNLKIPPFWIGKFVWDHWLVNATRDYAVDLTPSLLVGHLSHEYAWNWRVMERKSKDKVAEAKAIALKDIQWNAKVIDCENKPVFSCLPHQSTYDVAYQLCPGNDIRPMPKRADKLYDSAVQELRVKLKPKGQELAARRVYQTPALSGSSPSYWTEGIQEWALKHGCT